MSRLLRVLALMRDPRVAKLPRFAVIFAIAYLIWPIDVVPDFMAPVVGYLDDAVLLWVSLRWLLKSRPELDRTDITPQSRG
jgi:uncharacterized membrane protein YkvA (DUF1232 family)